MGNIAIFGGTFNPVHRGHLLLAEKALHTFCLDRIIWVPTYRPTHKSNPRLRPLLAPLVTPPVAPLVAFDQRLEMVRLAIAPHPQFQLSNVTVWHEQPSFAITTLLDLQGLYPGNQWFWIVGMDTFQTLPKWHKRDDLLAQCTWLIAPRQPQPTTTAAPIGAVQSLEMSPAIGTAIPAAQPTNPTTDWTKDRETAIATIQQVITQIELAQIEPVSLKWRLIDLPSVPISSSKIRQHCQQGESIQAWLPAAVADYIVAHRLYTAPPEVTSDSTLRPQHRT